MEQARPSSSSERRHRLDPWIVAAAAAAVYANTLALGFTLDDYTLIVDNPYIGDPAWLLSLFLKPQLWRPLKRVSLALDWRIWGLAHPAGFHATNVVFHAAACVALWAVAVRLRLGRWGALAAALLFAVHPLHVEAVANISHRKEPMALLFSLLGFLAYLRGREAEPRPGPVVRALARVWRIRPTARLARSEWVVAAAFAYLCGMLSKEVGAVMLPFAIVTHELLVARDPLRVRRARLAAFLPALGLVVALFTVRGYIGTLVLKFGPEQIRWATGDKASDYGTVARIAIQAFGKNVELLAWPWPLYFDRAFAIPTAFLAPGVLIGLAILVLYLVALFVSVRRSALAFFALAWIGWFLLPVSGVIPLTYWYVAERFLYAPSVGLALLAGMAVERAAGTRLGRSPAGRVTAVAVLTVFAIMTVVQNRVWTDQKTLFAHTLRYNRQSFRSLYGLGLAREKEGDAAGAEELFQEAIRVAPAYGEPYYALALRRLEQQRPDDAIALAESAARWMPDDPEPLVLIGNAQMDRERYAEAADAFRRAREADPKNADAAFDLGLALEAAGDSPGALRALEDAVALDPKGSEAREARDGLLRKLEGKP